MASGAVYFLFPLLQLVPFIGDPFVFPSSCALFPFSALLRLRPLYDETASHSRDPFFHRRATANHLVLFPGTTIFFCLVEPVSAWSFFPPLRNLSPLYFAELVSLLAGHLSTFPFRTKPLRFRKPLLQRCTHLARVSPPSTFLNLVFFISSFFPSSSGMREEEPNHPPFLILSFLPSRVVKAFKLCWCGP